MHLEGYEIREIKKLDNLTELGYLELAQNNITEIRGLEMLTKLKQLNLSGNQLTEIKGLISSRRF